MTEELKTTIRRRAPRFSVVPHSARVSYYFPEITTGHALLWLLATYRSAECQRVAVGAAGLGVKFG